MTTENTVLVRAPLALNTQLLDLVSRASNARARGAKMPPGDRTEMIRFDSLHAIIEQIAIAAVLGGEPFETLDPEDCGQIPSVSVFGPGFYGDKLSGKAASWINNGHLVVQLRLPHYPGKTTVGSLSSVGPPKAAERWICNSDERGEEVRARFDHLINSALKSEGSNEGCIRPSGVANRVLTSSLRTGVKRTPGQDRIDVPVIYRDGSMGAAFPLRALQMTEQIPTGWRCYRFALMSIRHVEMDHIVDGAWLRNMVVSRNRAAALTDAVVFETTLRQLERLSDKGPTLLYLYQTGLETAIIGFYRALTLHLIARPGSVAVVPCCFQSDDTFFEEVVWATN